MNVSVSDRIEDSGVSSTTTYLESLVYIKHRHDCCAVHFRFRLLMLSKSLVVSQLSRILQVICLVIITCLIRPRPV